MIYIIAMIVAMIGLNAIQYAHTGKIKWVAFQALGLIFLLIVLVVMLFE